MNTHFWDDNYIVELDPIEKLLFLYLVTNPLNNIAGVYEIKLRKVSFDTGIDKDMVQKIFDRFVEDEKIIYSHDYMILKNSPKHQTLNDSVVQGMKNIIKETPNAIIKHAVDSWGTEWGLYPYINLIQYNLIKSNQIGILPDGFFEKWFKFYNRKDQKIEKVKAVFNDLIHDEEDFKNLVKATRNYNALTSDKELKYLKVPTNFLAEYTNFVKIDN